MLHTSRRTWARAGFTIVELLIVIIVIAILATIVIVAYNGVQQQARVSLVKNDLSQGRRILENFKTDNGAATYPATQGSANLKPSNGVTYTYTPNSAGNPTDYCLTATLGTISYYTTGSNGEFQTGTCPPSGGVAASIVESTTGYYEVSSTTTGTFNITTNVQPTDLIVAIIWKGYLGTRTISGWGGTAVWSNPVDRQYTSYPDFFVYTTTGVSGPGSVTVTGTSTAFSVDVQLYVIRGLNGTAVADLQYTAADWTVPETPGNYRLVPSVSVGPGQAAIMTGWTASGTNVNGTFPAQPTPASGWTQDRQFAAYGTGTHYAAHLTPSTTVTATGGIYHTVYSQGGALSIVFGSP